LTPFEGIFLLDYVQICPRLRRILGTPNDIDKEQIRADAQRSVTLAPLHENQRRNRALLTRCMDTPKLIKIVLIQIEAEITTTSSKG
jgi:hypothetical protein